MKRAVLDQIEITSDGTVQVRMRKQIVFGEEVYDIGYHRTAIPREVNAREQMTMVNEDLVRMGFTAIEEKDISRICDHVNLENREEV